MKREVTVKGKTLKYSTTTGFLPLKSDSGEVEANIFYIAYTLDSRDAGAKRPLMFSFNGGPGSSSVWLHMGAIGPKRVKMLPDGSLPAAPYETETNEQTWLDAAGHAHTEQLHVIERFTRVNERILHYEATIEDPGAYSRPWSTSWNILFHPAMEPMEYICQENNKDLKHLVGK